LNKEFDSQYAEIAELARYASKDHNRWTEFNTAFARLYPGSMTNLTIYDRQKLTPVLVLSDDLPPELERAYLDYYGKINPWNTFWLRAQLGTPYSSRLTWPSKLFRDSEFYNDWLLKTGTIEAVGMKLATSDDEIVSFSTLFAPTAGEKNETHAMHLFDSISAAIVDGIRDMRFYSETGFKAVSAAALVERSPDMAFVVNHNRKLVAANEEAEAELSKRGIVQQTRGRVSLMEPAVAAWLDESMQLLRNYKTLIDSKRLVRWRGSYFQFSLARLPFDGAAVIPGRLSRPFLLLVVVREIRSGTPSSIGPGLFQGLFGVTAAEAEVCSYLRQGLTVSEIAEHRNVSRETVRFHLKSIFKKSGVGRQVDLIALLQKLS
jgi:DNA-binding CsgD family transcriptional regulator